jgi:molybdopterin-guanine dinucleotide biosynthesis protein A
VSRADAFLLAGGRSSRMGRDKALLGVGPLTFLEAVARAARPLARSITVVGREGEAGGYPAVADLRPGLGPLAGIETALSRAETDVAIVLACDLPLVTAELLELLAARAAGAPGAIVVARDAGGRLAPLCGLYPTAARESVSRLLDAGERRPRALLDSRPTVVVDYCEYAHLPAAERLLLNVNTPEEYEALVRSSRE